MKFSLMEGYAEAWKKVCAEYNQMDTSDANELLCLIAELVKTYGDPKTFENDGPLDIINGYQYMHEEKTQTLDGTTKISTFTLNKRGIVSDSLSGEIYRNGILIQTFYIRLNNIIILSDEGEQSIKVIPDGFSIDGSKGELTLVWNEVPGEHYLVVSYEYEYR
jgi:hypothetical protein